jgi:hypothetical protein
MWDWELSTLLSQYGETAETRDCTHFFPEQRPPGYVQARATRMLDKSFDLRNS